MANYLIQLEDIKANLNEDEIISPKMFSESRFEHIDELNEKEVKEAKELFYNFLEKYNIVVDRKNDIITFSEDCCKKYFIERFRKLAIFFNNESNFDAFTFPSKIEEIIKQISNEYDWQINSNSQRIYLTSLDEFVRSRFQANYGSLSYQETTIDAPISFRFIKVLNYM